MKIPFPNCGWWTPTSENGYIRIEHAGLETETGVENFSSFVPFETEELERLRNELGGLK